VVQQKDTKPAGLRISARSDSLLTGGTLQNREFSSRKKKAVYFTLSFNLAEQLHAFFRAGEHVP